MEQIFMKPSFIICNKMILDFIKLKIPLIVRSITLRFILQEEMHVMGEDMWYVYSIELSRYRRREAKAASGLGFCLVAYIENLIPFDLSSLLPPRSH